MMDFTPRPFRPSTVECARIFAHQAFDEIWQGEPRGARSRAYEWLAREMGLPRDDCHIALFDIDQCLRVIDLSVRAKNRA